MKQMTIGRILALTCILSLIQATAAHAQLEPRLTRTVKLSPDSASPTMVDIKAWSPVGIPIQLNGEDLTGLVCTMAVKRAYSDTALWIESVATGVNSIVTFPLTAAQTATNITEKIQWVADFRIPGYGAPLPPLKIRVSPTAFTGTETAIRPVTDGYKTNGAVVVLSPDVDYLDFEYPIVGELTGRDLVISLDQNGITNTVDATARAGVASNAIAIAVNAAAIESNTTDIATIQTSKVDQATFAAHTNDLANPHQVTLQQTTTAGSTTDVEVTVPAVIFDGTDAGPAPGKMVFNTAKDNHVLYNSRTNTALDVGYEGRAHMCNTTTGTIANLTPVYISGITNGCKIMSVASSVTWYESRLIGLTTEAIGPGETGEVVLWGDAGGDLTGISVGIVYLGDGVLTSTRPSGGSFAVTIGYCMVTGASGFIFIQPQIPELAVEVTDTNGFPTDQRDGTTISFTNATRTLAITPTGERFHFYDEGAKYEKTAAESIAIANVEGLHVVYYDSDTLTTVANPNAGQVDQVIRLHALVAYVYWDAANQVSRYIGDERHGISMSPVTHSYLHFSFGSRYLTGGSLGDLNSAGSGADNSHAEFSVTSGFFADEDIVHVQPAKATNDTLTVYYLDGVNGYLRSASSPYTGGKVLNGTTTGRLLFNEFTGGAWTTTEVSNNDFMHYHTFWVNGIAGLSDQVIQIMGQQQYGTANSAKNGLPAERESILSRFPQEEIVGLGSVLYQTSTSYANDYMARIRPDADGQDYAPWPRDAVSSGAAPSDHANLTGRDSVAQHPASSITTTNTALGANVDEALAALLPRAGGEMENGAKISVADTITIEATNTTGRLVIGPAATAMGYTTTGAAQIYAFLNGIIDFDGTGTSVTTNFDIEGSASVDTIETILTGDPRTLTTSEGILNYGNANWASGGAGGYRQIATTRDFPCPPTIDTPYTNSRYYIEFDQDTDESSFSVQLPATAAETNMSAEVMCSAGNTGTEIWRIGASGWQTNTCPFTATITWTETIDANGLIELEIAHDLDGTATDPIRLTATIEVSK